MDAERQNENQGYVSKYIGGFESSLSIAPSTATWNNFLEDHPQTAEELREKFGEHADELEALDESIEADRVSLHLLARDCEDVLCADASPSVKRGACMAKLGTIVRMQNPALATEECIVFKKAKELGRNFEMDQAMMYRYQGVSLDELKMMPNPADEMLRVFNEHVDETYDMPALEARACATLTPYIGLLNPDHVREFEAIVGYERIDGPTRVARFGSSVTARIVTLQCA